MKWRSMITKKTWDEKAVVCHKSTSDEGALVMMCGRDEFFWLSATIHWKIAMACAHYKVSIVGNEHWEN
jgi:hypothetical protein